MPKKLRIPKLHESDLKEIKKDFSKGRVKALRKTFENATIKTIQSSVLCALCVNMVVYNVNTLATTCACIGCSFFIAVPTYKALKAVISDPFKGFKN